MECYPFSLRTTAHDLVVSPGGDDSDDPLCLYKAYGAAVSALGEFEGSLAKTVLPRWFLAGHLAGAMCVLSGVFLLVRAFWF